ncbi:MAG: YgiQ family radical SAM protein [Epulopiscium sp. Nele67-Bin002]|nr:MAG: YgiQ family radical SAM protein [Epulopiscium sp. Nuni2H_MBin001]OON92424.1 MAG: YgiQ family radical SAM protein [Epulopiscium sp. Nele67-Bin002]OON93626.1 MAG: YgiQ family radical SAM protein [Epulopiscium sp. Nele67-Bin001]
MFLPVSKEELEQRAVKSVDFVLVTGDAYIDHCSFGTAIIGRVLERYGYSVAILSQPNWKDCSDFKRFGKPRLGFLIGSGNIDSMVNHYSVNKKRRKQDAYTEGGVIGKRPDRAVIVYSGLARAAYKDVPIIIGGIEASLRRLAHYDYWDNKVRRSILIDSGADLLLYGMSETSVVELAQALESGIDVKHITFIAGTTYKTKTLDMVYEGIELPTYEAASQNKIEYCKSFVIQYNNTDAYTAKPLIESYGKMGYVVQNPPSKPLTTLELDDIYELPFMNAPHPIYTQEIPAIKEILFSITSNRGCFGSCSFCALTFHQGRTVQGRSENSMIEEATKMTLHPKFKGYIHDVGGPTANFSQAQCTKAVTHGTCRNKKCLYPAPCKSMNIDHTVYMRTLRKIREIKGIKKVFVRSGIRYDYLLADKNSKAIIKELATYHVSGQLRIAPEHIADNALRHMGKPKREVYEKFTNMFSNETKKIGKEQYVVPYFMSSHPGATLEDAVELALYLKKIQHIPEQVQDFYPTPSTLATCMYYTELDPFTLEKVYVAKSVEEKAMQRALLQYNKKENYSLVYKAIVRCNRNDLIGNSNKCLIRRK